jgi:hypothetical protein
LWFSIVGRKLRGKKRYSLCPEIILDWFNPFLHEWYYSTYTEDKFIVFSFRFRLKDQ